MLAHQPFRNRAELMATAEEVWWKLGEKDWLEAFAHHPRIGDANVTDRTARLEQSGVTGADGHVVQALAKGNRRYEEKNGFVFLMCATGKSAPEILAVLEKRLRNDCTTELKIAAAEQVKIMKLRLERTLT